MSLDIYMVAAKGRHEDQGAAGFDGDVATSHTDQVIAHGGHLNDDEWRDTANRIVDAGARNARMESRGTAALLEPALLGFAGKHPADLLAALPSIYKALSGDDRTLCRDHLGTIQFACRHAIKLEQHPQHGELYEDMRVVILKDGSPTKRRPGR